MLSVFHVVGQRCRKLKRLPHRLQNQKAFVHAHDTKWGYSILTVHTKAMAWHVVQLTSQEPSAKFQLTEPYEPALHTQVPSDRVVGQETALQALGVLSRSSLKPLLHWKSSPATVLPAPVQLYEPLPLGMVSQAV